MTLVVGLTGRIGSGKTTVAQLFANKGAPTIDADVLAHQLTQAGQDAFLAIQQHFQSDILLANGQLDRKKLRQLVFSQPEERKWLENLLHPLICQEIEDQLAKLSSPYCIVIIPLLIETGPYPFIDRILVIDTSTALQIQRTALRDHVMPASIEAILHTQATRNQQLQHADDIIQNNGKITELAAQVEALHVFYLNLSENQ